MLPYMPSSETVVLLSYLSDCCCLLLLLLLLLLQWYEGELEKPLLLSKARAAADAVESLENAEKEPSKKAAIDVQQAMPAYLKGRVARGEGLPVLELVGRDDGGKRRLPKKKRALELERRAVLEHVVCVLNTDLFLDLMAGLRYR